MAGRATSAASSAWPICCSTRRSPRAAAVKINVAFFEAFGSAGIAALERVRARIPDDVPFIADAKRGDIGTTVARQAVALFDSLDAHAVTASPYLGGEAIAPLLERADRFVYVLCRTSNPGAASCRTSTSMASRCTSTSRAARRRGRQDRANVGPGRRRHRARASSSASVRQCPGWPFLVPGSRRAGRRHRRSQALRSGHDGPVGVCSRRRPCWSTCRAASPRQRSAAPIPEARGRRPRPPLGAQPPVLG